MKVSSPKTGTSNFEETIPTPKMATTPVDPHAKLIHTFNEKAALLDFVNEIRKADAKCEGVVEAEQLKAVTESLGIQAAPEEVAGLFEACHPVRTPREGRRVVQIQSLARHLWPQAQRPHIQKAKTLSKEPKHLFGLRAAGLLNDTREAALRDIGEIGPLQHINSNFSSSVLDPLNWKQARLKHGPWLGERPLLRMEARSPTTVYAEDGWERTATKIANATDKFHSGLRMSSVPDFLTHPRHYDFLTCTTPANPHRAAEPPDDFRPFRVNSHACIAPTRVRRLKGERMAADEKPATAPEAVESVTQSYRAQDTLNVRERTREPDRSFATNKVMPSIRSLRLFHPTDAYRSSKLDVSDIIGASPASPYAASSLRAAVTQPLPLRSRSTGTLPGPDNLKLKAVVESQECPERWREMVPIRNSAFSLMQSAGHYTNSLRPGKHVW